MYQPRSGSPTAKLIEYLSSHDGPVKSTDMAAAAGVTTGWVNKLIAPALRHGLAVRLGPGVYQRRDPSANDGWSPPPTKRSAAAEAAPASVPSAFSVGVYSDGDVVLLNPAELGDGYARLSRDQAIALMHFLAGRDLASLPSGSPALACD